MKSNQKLYVVTRRDLPPGSQAVQGMHALVEFMLEYPSLIREWHDISNYLCFLSVADEQELQKLADTLHEEYLIRECFYEPDLKDSLTALVINATDEASALVRHLPLALK